MGANETNITTIAVGELVLVRSSDLVDGAWESVQPGEYLGVDIFGRHKVQVPTYVRPFIVTDDEILGTGLSNSPFEVVEVAARYTPVATTVHRIEQNTVSAVHELKVRTTEVADAESPESLLERIDEFLVGWW